MSPPMDGTFPDAEADELARRIDEAARAAYAEYLRLVDTGVAPRDAVATVMATFDERYYEALAAGFSKVLGAVWTARQVSNYLVGGIALSARLYRQHRATSEAVAAIVREHVKGLHQARQLALELYLGYGLRRGERLKVMSGQWRTLPKPLRGLAKDMAMRQVIVSASSRAAASRLRTDALRSAYLQTFDAAMKGASEARLRNLLKVAVHEKSRYFANRIAQTELARAHSDAVARELMADATIEVVQWRLSGAHPAADICDLFANVDRYGLGPGCYPKAKAPKPIAHPFCRCRLRSRPDLRARDARERPAAEREHLRGFEIEEAARLVGSRARLQQILNGKGARETWNLSQGSGYEVKTLSEALRASGGKLSRRSAP